MSREKTKQYSRIKRIEKHEHLEDFQALMPMIVDQYGRIIDGWHRKDAGWTKKRLLPVKDDLDFWVIRLHSNLEVMRPNDPCLGALFWIIGIELVRKGTPRVEVCHKIASEISPYPEEYTEALVADVFKPDKFALHSRAEEPLASPELPPMYRSYFEHGICLHDLSRLYRPITDLQWLALAPLMPAYAGTGRPRSDDRATLEAILYHFETGTPWDELPRTFVRKSTANDRLLEWTESKLWAKILRNLKSTGYEFSDNT